MGVSMAGRKTPEKKAPGEAGEGYRVFRVKLNRRVRGELERLYRRLAARDPSLPKSAFRYHKSWEEERRNVREMRERAGKRIPPRRDPAYYLLARIIKDGERVHGTPSAPVVIDLSRGELRIPCAGIRVHLKPSLVRALEEELRLDPKPEFAVQLTCRGRLRIIAFRSPPKWWLYREECADLAVTRLEPPVRVVGVDLNSVYGLTVVVFDVTEGGVRVPKSPMRWQPPNDTLYLAEAAVLRKIAQGLPPTPPDNADEEELQLWQWALGRVRRLETRTGALTTERADRLRRQLEQAARLARRRWARKVVHELRQLIREVGGRAVVAADVPDPESLRNSRLQKTYLRVVKLVENLCAYEGALYRRVRASGRVCPLCGSWCEEVGHRYYRCPKCNVIFDRDYGGAFNAALEALPPLLADALKGWLCSHPKALARNYANPAAARAAAELNRLRAPLPGTPSGRPARSGALPGGRARDEGVSSREALRRRGAERREQAATSGRPHDPPRSSTAKSRGGRRAGPED
ncbi:MAG: zinc ribbon domain-containing protein [Thermofilum sp.]